DSRRMNAPNQSPTRIPASQFSGDDRDAANALVLAQRKFSPRNLRATQVQLAQERRSGLHVPGDRLNPGKAAIVSRLAPVSQLRETERGKKQQSNPGHAANHSGHGKKLSGQQASKRFPETAVGGDVNEQQGQQRQRSA